MSGARLYHKVAISNNLPEAFVRKLLFDALFEIEAIVAETGRCQIRGFGTFKLKKMVARQGRDLVRSSIVQIPAKNKLVFEHGRDRIPFFCTGKGVRKT